MPLAIDDWEKETTYFKAIELYLPTCVKGDESLSREEAF